MTLKEIQKLEALNRFADKIQRADNGCWVWTGGKNPNGYGSMTINQRKVLAHRFAYENFRMPIPPELELDHLCRNPSCANPFHLEPVTHSVNILRGKSFNKNKTHCINGHEYTTENTFLKRGGRARECRTCREIREERRIR